MPGDAIRVLDRDLLAAGLARCERGRGRKGRKCWRIDKRDERGRTFDIHAFRTTFNSLLAAAGVPLTTRRILMRHAAETVTDEHYVDAKLIDLRGAPDKLPLLPLHGGRPDAEPQAATGTDGKSDTDARFMVCRAVCSAHDKPSTSGTIVDSSQRNAELGAPSASDAVAERSESLSIACESGRPGSNRQQSAWKADALPIELRPHKPFTCSALLRSSGNATYYISVRRGMLQKHDFLG